MLDTILDHQLPATNARERFSDDVQATEQWVLVSHSQIVAGPPIGVDWHVRDLIESSSGPVLLYGPPGAYRSWIAMHICHCIATGADVFGRYPVIGARDVVYINLDAGAIAFNRRLYVFPPCNNFYVVQLTEFSVTALEKALYAHPGAFVCIDCFANIYAPDPHVEQGLAMRRFVQGLRRIYESNGSTGIIIDHSRRPRVNDTNAADSTYGSIQKVAVFRGVWRVAGPSGVDRAPGHARIKVTCEKMSEAESFADLVIDLDWTPSTFSAAYVPPDEAAVKPATKAAEAVLQVLSASPEPLSRRAIMQQTGYGRDLVLAGLKQPGIKQSGRGKNARYVIDQAQASSKPSPAEDGEADA